jgi:glutathione S-transferase
MLQLYGLSASRAFRPLWLLEELGLDYRHIPLDYRGPELQTPDYLALNPNARIPTLVDGELVLWESMAINLYLASRYGRTAGLWPATPAGEGLAYQWSFWVMTEVERALLTVLFHRRLLPAAERDPAKLARSEGVLHRPFDILDGALKQREWLADDHFTVADLDVAAVLAWAKAARLDLAPWPRLGAWLAACLARPAAQRARRKP